ncbi:hypothetical protein QYM36_009681 [Artemia franciscana]|uniref:Integrin beta subunit VWA domain-containing protein n=1 Tax=Artemia franciscana TaxID=6661 RepID=A0AA88L2A6_ARTSF|nr:hypothetical protein QYM36_009681 [Artemia franciscana]KAK2713877.1 hypothetical protein QYM36_009681 [Artemia franciscana]
MDLNIRIIYRTSVGLVALIGAELGTEEEPIQDVDVYVMADVTQTNELERLNIATAVVEMFEKLKLSETQRRVRISLGTLYNRKIGSHQITSYREKRRRIKAERSRIKAKRMLKNCRGKKCLKWYKLKKFHERQLTPIIHCSYRHQLNFTEDMEEFIDVFVNATQLGMNYPVSSQWEALLQASVCPEIADWNNNVQKILLYINQDGILEPQAFIHRRLSRSGLRCSTGDFVSTRKLSQKHLAAKLTNTKIADFLMEARIRLLVGIPFSKKTFTSKRIFRAVPNIELVVFGRSYISFGEKVAGKIESMVNNKNGIIHNAPWPLIVRNAAQQCTRRMMKKAAKHNRTLSCLRDDGAQAWNVTVELRRCRRKSMEKHIYFNIWAYAFNAVLGVNSTLDCSNIPSADGFTADSIEDDLEVESWNDASNLETEGMAEDPDEATEQDTEFHVEADLEQVTELPDIDEEEITMNPDAEMIDTEIDIPEVEESPGCLSVRDCVICNILGDKEGETCGHCHVTLQSIDTEEVKEIEKCGVRLGDGCIIDFYIIEDHRSSSYVLAEMSCVDLEEDDDDGILL